ncbi:MAG: OprO/OprP family phosphate-selective porin, partial [Zoogloeaceae bacterium]|nr:OprO/OprP family phosphate-selective porin [Zoogloeaceae bacterium]
PVSEAAFNPAVSLVLMGTYTRLSQDPNHYAIHGFIPGGNEMGPPKRSFGLGESELGISANIDHRLRGQFTASLSADGDVGVEEAFIQTLALGNGATLKAGRMFSGIGYLNGQHPHAWDFADAPLAYGAFLGSQWKNDGIQAMWVAPTALWIELGGEMGAGGAFPSTDRNKNGNTAGALFAHIGGDAGDSASWRAGLSVLGVSPRDRRYEDVDGLGNPVTNSFSGKSRTWIADAIWKQELAHGGRLIVQGEYFRRRENGTLVWDVDGAGLADGYSATQSGFYAQAVWQFAPLWRVGYRYDRLDSGKADLGSTLNPDDLPMLAAYKPRRNTLMIDFSPSEFSRLRLQLARDQSRRDLTDNQLWLQYIVNLGAHGPHHH